MYIMLSKIFYVLCNVSCVRDLHLNSPTEGNEVVEWGESRGSPKYSTSCGRFRCVLLIRYRVVNGTIGKFIGGTIDIVICIYTFMYIRRQ